MGKPHKIFSDLLVQKLQGMQNGGTSISLQDEMKKALMWDTELYIFSMKRTNILNPLCSPNMQYAKPTKSVA